MPNIQNLFTGIPANARVWIYQSNREFTAQEAAQIEQLVQQFVGEWTAHKLKVAAGGALLYNRFVVLVADEREVGVSGCSIDSSVRVIKELGAQYGVDFFDRFHIAYKVNGEVRSTDRNGFEAMIAAGKVTADTVVFNNIVETLADFRSKWEVPLSQSWHARVFQFAC